MWSIPIFQVVSVITAKPLEVEFVKADLAQANKNRDVRPWIITMGHRPMYCSNGNHEGRDPWTVK